MLLLVRVIHIPRCKTLEVHEVAALVSATDPLDLNGAGNLHLFA